MTGIVNVLETKDSARESVYLANCTYQCIGDNKELMISNILCSLNELARCCNERNLFKLESTNELYAQCAVLWHHVCINIQLHNYNNALWHRLSNNYTVGSRRIV